MSGETGISTWTITTSPNLSDGVTYYIRSLATDLANNTQATATEIKVICDRQGPAVSFTLLSNADLQASSRRSSLPTISGTAEDTGVGTITEVRWQLKNLRLNKYWDGSGYALTDFNISGSSWVAVRSGANPQFSVWFDTFSWPTDEQYQIEVRARDSLGNYSLEYATITFTLDADVPSATVDFPKTGTVIRTIAAGLSGTAWDTGVFNAGSVVQVKIGIQRLSDNKWFDYTKAGLGFNAFGYDTNPGDNATWGGGPSWSFSQVTDSNLESGTSYYITIQPKDNATIENYPSFGVISSTFTFDNVAPAVGFIRPPSGTNFYTSVPTISGTAVDAVSPVQTVQVAIQKASDNYWWIDPEGDGSGSWSNTNPSTAIPCALTASTATYRPASGFNVAQGATYRVFIRAWDVPGSTSAWSGPNQFTYDNEAPTSTITSPIKPSGKDLYVNTPVVTISGTAYDAPAGVSSVEIAIASNAVTPAGSWWNGGSWTDANEVWISTNVSYERGTPDDVWVSSTPVLENGKKYLVKIRTIDAAGKSNIRDGITFIYDSIAPEALLQAPKGYGPGNAFEGPVTLLNISGTASDNSGDDLAEVRVWISTGTDWYWNGLAWQH
jgi:hypothetical protein